MKCYEVDVRKAPLESKEGKKIKALIEGGFLMECECKKTTKEAPKHVPVPPVKKDK